jgi:gliding motility-associated-like protein
MRGALMKRHFLGLFYFFIVCLIFSHQVKATHIRAGEITAVRQSCQGFRHTITVVGYTDTRSPVQFAAGEIDFGDGSPSVRLDQAGVLAEQRSVGEHVMVNRYTISHTFPGNGSYIISYREQNRNGGVLNMDNSVNTPFYIETRIVIDPYLGCNNTPELLVPPVDKAAVGAMFLHNPGAFDVDGDSLAYKLVVNKQDRDLNVAGYVYPNNQRFNGRTEEGNSPATFNLDAVIGDMVWNSPGQAGEYNVAFIIEEWRRVDGQWFPLGYVTRDMQIIVEETDNERPELIIPPDTCVVAGANINALIQAQDPDGDDVMIEAFGGVFQLFSSPANFSPSATFMPSPASGTFNWQTNCSHVRERPFTVQFKATDRPNAGPRLVDFKTWNIRVVGPEPQGLTAAIQPDRSVTINWDDYACPNGSKMQIWRRVGSYDFEKVCQPGVPEHAGYQLVDEVNIGDKAFSDNNKGKGLDVGANYCYRLVAVFPEPAGGRSLASDEVCVQMDADGPVIVNVSVEETDKENGEVYIRWTPPFDIDPALFPGPYTYEVVRKEGLTGGGTGEIVARITPDDQNADIEFTDQGLNTRDLAYSYTIYLYNEASPDNPIRSSATASTVYLDVRPGFEELRLLWQANVPWSNNTQGFPYHEIFRDQASDIDPDLLVLIDSTNVNFQRFVYLDDGSAAGPLSDTQEYCYYVITKGAYGNIDLAGREPLLNKSQIVCAQPNDTIPPCPPTQVSINNLSLEECQKYVLGLPCDFNNFTNTLAWQESTIEGCKDDVFTYDIYYSPNPDHHPFEVIANVNTPSFQHEGLRSMAGCYYIRTIDRSGNVSQESEVVCNDNCPNFQLPNVFTPNNDGYNDEFTAYEGNREKCPRFVESIHFRVYNRWGKEVYSFVSESEEDAFIRWDGTTNQGRELPGGVYYYLAEVRFFTVDPAKEKKKYKGWIQIFRNRADRSDGDPGERTF